MKNLIPCFAALLVFSCAGVEKDWEHEVILYLFKRANLDVNPLTLTFKQGDQETKQLKDLSFTFLDCESNRIRIIPGSQEPLTIQIECSTPALCEVQDTTLVDPMTEDTVSIVLTKGGELEPVGECGPPPADLKKPVGSACAGDGECQGDLCLTSLPNLGSGTFTFKGGYCSSTCNGESVGCPGGQCHGFKDGLGNEYFYCLKSCSGATDCRLAEDYYCPSSGGFCTPR